ncbi:hypothetical protein ABZ816_03120 [Actinosynnema sp. NPDC047251]|uniref:Uncharacterized protein n=1 Tax=Saccharothrix espanaensis (strain ATCC 51144 / DSM 44229 / JCM 9112 / NBRC 15066 / NRRL 15764) TaxID=1179773 RepID=K0JYN4_SACES|nr:hypothetical protein [Saccharothrix espanaensis]CCH31246.1 hypothetical protein BN6_39580 [Saccharothrix espanaensis DSM 44229]
MTITANRLLRSLDPLPHGSRQRLLAGTARELVGTPALDGLLRELSGGDRFSRGLAVRIAHVAGHGEFVVRAATWPETEVARHALASAGRLDLPTTVFLDLLPHLSTDLRRTLYRAVRRRNRGRQVDELLPVVRAAYGDVEAAGLLASCTTETVRALLPELEHAVRNWTALGRRHPEVLLDFVGAELDGSAPTWWSDVWGRVAGGVAAAAATHPERVLGLVERVLPHAPLPWALHPAAARLARHDPRRLAAVLVDPRRTGPVPARPALWRALAALPDADLVAVGRVLPERDQGTFLRTLPPSRRAAVVAGVYGDRLDLPAGVLDQLPAPARAEFGRRLLDRPAVADDPVRRLAATALLPWAQARDALLAATRRATADDRATGHELCVRAAVATRDPAVLAEVVANFARLANDQDPVRSRALAAFAEVPSWLFRVADVDAYGKLMADAADARDASWQTRYAVRGLAQALIREGVVARRPELVDAGRTGLARIAEQAAIGLHGIGRALPRGAEHEVFAALEPRLSQDARRGEFDLLLPLATGLGRRAWDLPRLQELLDRARSAKSDRVVTAAIGLWLAPPRTRDDRVRRVLADDRSTITVDVVREVVARRCTDLLDLVIGKPLHGRFLKRGVRYVPPFPDCAERWLPRQVDAYRDQLLDCATSARVPVFERASAVARLGRLPGSVAEVRGFTTDPDVPVAEAALATLAWTDDPADVLPDLLEHVGTDRARVAVYALSRCARFTSPRRLGELLAPLVTGGKVTTRKEAVRLLAQHRAPGAVAVLAGAWDGAHRDVRRALVSATRWFLDDDTAWDLLTRATAEQCEVAAEVLEQPPAAVPRRHRVGYGELVLAVAASADPDTARRGLAALPAWLRWVEGTADLLVGLVVDLDNTATWEFALSALVRAARAQADPEPLRRAVTGLLAVADRYDAETDRDLPGRRRIEALVRQVAGQADSAGRRAEAGALGPVLAAAGHHPAAVRLAVLAVPWGEPGADLAGLRDVARVADRPALRRQASEELAVALSGVLDRLPPDRPHELAGVLAVECPALAVAVATAAGPAAGWPARWRELVRGLRRHDDPDVRDAALAVRTDQT